jgi:pyruvate dehydrogenase E1 component alpha subunit
VRDAAARAIASARDGRPTLLETVSSRLRGHSVVDPAAYRSKEEAAALRAADPLFALAARLHEAGALTDEAEQTLEDEVGTEVTAAVAFAEASPPPEAGTLFDHTYATPVPNDLRRLPAQPLFAGVTA